MRETKEIEKLIRNFSIEINPHKDQEILEEVLQAQAQKPGTGPYLIWSTITKSRITKFAAAAVIIFAVLVGINQFGGSIDGAAVAFGQMETALQKVPWAHYVYTNSRRNSEGWYSFTNKVKFTKRANGKIKHRDYSKTVKYEYEPKTNMITLTDILHEKFAFGACDAFSFTGAYLDNELARGAIIVRKNGVYNNKPVEIWKITRPKGNRSKEITIFSDLQSHLPLAVKIKSGIPGSEPDYIGNITMDYPLTGPQDIYALGVPRDTKIVNQLDN